MSDIADDEQDYLRHGHPALYQAAAFGTELGEEVPCWSDDLEEQLEVDRTVGELALNEVNSVVGDTAPSKNETNSVPVSRRTSNADKYGITLPPDLANSLMPASKDGLIWHAVIIADDLVDLRFCTADGSIKPRRPLPHVRASNFFSSLSVTSDGRWCFTGVLNRWPALTNLEVISIKARLTRLTRPYIKELWNADAKTKPAFPEDKKIKTVRATLRAPAWSLRGYAANVPGFVFWYNPHRRSLSYGISVLKCLDELTSAASLPRAHRVHLIAHRYAKEHESTKDKLVYHCVVVIEWQGYGHLTLVELAWWGGLGGYAGKSNWYADKDSPRTALYSSFPAELKAPWRSRMSEIRILDLFARSLDEFKSFLAEYTGPRKRFLDPSIAASADVRLTLCSQRDIFTYLLNYASNETLYSEKSRNCQTFAADFFALLSGRHNTEPYSAVNRLMYKRHLDWFLYNPD